jgi:phage terminase small subunit
MPILRNPKWERFAQELAGGKTAGQAYGLAGFSSNSANAWRLQRKDYIRRRVDEILARKERAADKAVENAAERAGLDEFWVMRTLRRNSVLAARKGDIAASNRAAELIGKHLSMFIDRKAIEVTYSDDSDAYLRQLLELVQAPVIEHEPAAEDGQKYGPEETLAPDTVDIVEEVG